MFFESSIQTAYTWRNNPAGNAFSNGAGKWSKGKAVTLQSWSDTECSRKLSFPDFMTTAQDGGKVAAFNPRKCSWYSFLLEAESTPGP